MFIHTKKKKRKKCIILSVCLLPQLIKRVNRAVVHFNRALHSVLIGSLLIICSAFGFVSFPSIRDQNIVTKKTSTLLNFSGYPLHEGPVQISSKTSVLSLERHWLSSGTNNLKVLFLAMRWTQGGLILVFLVTMQPLPCGSMYWPFHPVVHEHFILPRWWDSCYNPEARRSIITDP